MKIERKLHKASLKDMMAIFLFSFIVLNGLSYLIFTIIYGKPYDEFFLKHMILLLIFPLIQGIIQSFANRNGILIVEYEDGLLSVRKRIESLLEDMNYEKSVNDNITNEYCQKNKLKRLFNPIFDGRLKISFETDLINVLGKKEVLNRFETRLRYEQNK